MLEGNVINLINKSQGNVMDLNRDQVKVLEGAAFAWHQDCEDQGEETAGYRSGEWLLPDYWHEDFDFHALVNSGMLETSDELSPEEDEYFRITQAGLRLLNN
jgi:hypothetical protein